MQVAILGLGRFGTQLALTLADQGHDVLACDRSDIEVQALSEHVSRAAIVDITDPDGLRDLGLPAMDVGVVATGQLEASVLATMHLIALGVPSVIAKASSEGHATILSRIGAHRVVQPERDGGERVAHLLQVQTAQDYLTLTRDYGIGVYAPPERLFGQPLDVLDREGSTRRLLMVVRDDEVELNPVRSQVLQPGDTLVFAGRDADLAREL